MGTQGFAACADHMGMTSALFALCMARLRHMTQSHNLKLQCATNLRPNMCNSIFLHMIQLILFRYFDGPTFCWSHYNIIWVL